MIFTSEKLRETHSCASDTIDMTILMKYKEEPLVREAQEFEAKMLDQLEQSWMEFRRSGLRTVRVLFPKREDSIF